jgi:hypothetical protein
MAVSRRQVEYSAGEKYARVEITVICHDLVTDEIEGLANTLADDAMRSMNQARFLHAPLSKIKAQRKRK